MMLLLLLLFVSVLVARRLCCGNLHRQAQPSQRLISIALAFCPCEFTSITDNHANLYFSIWHLLASVGVGLCRTFYTPPTDCIARAIALQYTLRPQLNSIQWLHDLRPFLNDSGCCCFGWPAPPSTEPYLWCGCGEKPAINNSLCAVYISP